MAPSAKSLASFAAAAAEDPMLSETALGSHLTDLTTILEDRAEQSETPLGHVTSGRLGYANQVVAGIWGAGNSPVGRTRVLVPVTLRGRGDPESAGHGESGLCNLRWR